MAAEFDPSRKVDDAKASNEAVGWGSWTGMGAPPPRPRKLPKKLMAPKKKEASRKRKDDRKPDVIINQKRLKKTANGFMLGDVPHPFSSRYEYEQAILGGVGREWNVSGAFRNMTRPEILTRSGNMIKPIPKRTKVKRAPAKF
jgi:U3 small nucleolar RNA-associated protein 14